MKILALTRGFSTIIDDEDFDRLGTRKWHAIGKPPHVYAARSIRDENGRKVMIYLHREVAEAEKGQYVDHRDHETLNNVRSNVRICTQSQNLANITRVTGSVPYKGVVEHRPGTFVAAIRMDNVRRYLGSFRTPEAAAHAYDAARKASGEFAGLNFPS